MVRKVCISADTAASFWIEIKTPIKNAPAIPRIEPIAAPIKVLSDARLTRISKAIMSIPIMPPRIAEKIRRVPSSIAPKRVVRSNGLS